jgi:hypothetical protein
MSNSPSETQANPERTSSRLSTPPLTFSGNTSDASSEVPSHMDERVTKVQDRPNEPSTARCNSVHVGETYPNGQLVTSSPPPLTHPGETEQASSDAVDWESRGPGTPTPGGDVEDWPPEVEDEPMPDVDQQEDEDRTGEVESGS